METENQCKCGCNRVQGNALPLSIEIESIAFLGSGVILFFFYTKRIFLVVLGCLLIYGIFSLITNIVFEESTENCEKPGAFPFLCSWKISSSLSNKNGHQEYLVPQLWLGFVMCLFWGFAVHLIRAEGRKKNREIDDQLESSADYQIFIENLPIRNYHEEEILNLIQQLWDNLEEKRSEHLEIKGVQIIYNMETVREKINKIYDLARRLCNCLEKEGTNGYQIKSTLIKPYISMKAEILNLQDELSNFRSNFITSQKFRQAYASECTLVEFGREDQLKDFLINYGQPKKSFMVEFAKKIKQLFTIPDEPLFKERQVKIMKSPEPSDIKWKNCEKPNQAWRTLLSWAIILCLCGVLYGALALLTVIQ